MMKVDKDLISKRFSKAVGTYDGAAAVQDAIAERMVSLLQYHDGRRGTAADGRNAVGKVLEIGCGTGLFTRKFLKAYSPERMWLNDICQDYEESLSDILCKGKGDTVCPESVPGTGTDMGGGFVFLPGDAESLDLPQGLDMVVSCSAFQWFHDMPAFLRKASDALNEGGILAFSTFGPDNLREISALEGVSLHYLSLAGIKSMIPEGMEILCAEECRQVRYFSSAMSVLRHLKDTGVAGIRREFWTRSRLEGFDRRYRERFSSVGGLPLTYHPMWLVCRSCHFDRPEGVEKSA